MGAKMISKVQLGFLRKVALAACLAFSLASCTTHSSFMSFFTTVTDASEDAEQFAGHYVRIKNMQTGRYLSAKDGNILLAAWNAPGVDRQEFFLAEIEDGAGKPLFALALIDRETTVIQSAPQFKAVNFEPRFENVIEFGKLTRGWDGGFFINMPVASTAALTPEALRVQWTDVDGKLSLETMRDLAGSTLLGQLWAIEVVEGEGPQDLGSLVGKWEFHRKFHSNDNNSLTGVEVDDRQWDGVLQQYGWQGMSLTFEDGFSLDCHGRDGVVRCTDGFTVPGEAALSFSIMDSAGRVDVLHRYLDQAQGYLLVHNGAAYDAETWASWTEIGFGGKRTQHTTPKSPLSLLGTESALNITDEELFVIPGRHRDLKVFIDPDDGLNRITTISNPPVDNSCFRIRGDLVSAELVEVSGGSYRYVDRDCTFSSNARRQQQAAELMNSDAFKDLAARLKKAHTDGLFEGFDKDNPAHHERIRAALLPEQETRLVSRRRDDQPPLTYVSTTSEPSGEEFEIQSFSVGVTEEVSALIVGEQAEAGVIFDGFFYRPYFSIGGGLDIGTGADVGVAVGFWTDRVCDIASGGSMGIGTGFATPDGGIGAEVYFSSDPWRLIGFELSPEIGAEAVLFKFLYFETAVGKLERVSPSKSPVADQGLSGCANPS